MCLKYVDWSTWVCAEAIIYRVRSRELLFLTSFPFVRLFSIHFVSFRVIWFPENEDDYRELRLWQSCEKVNEVDKSHWPICYRCHPPNSPKTQCNARCLDTASRQHQNWDRIESNRIYIEWENNFVSVSRMQRQGWLDTQFVYKKLMITSS